MRAIDRRHYFVGVTAIILAVSTTLWAWVSARLQMGNSDQLVDGFLFQNLRTFRGASFPSEHTQLIKWPLFALVHMFHFSPAIYMLLTMLTTLLTVTGFAYFLYRVNRRRPLIVGVLYLMLALVLAMVPAQAAGVTAPLNMAMLTGRNVEYLLYIGSLVLLVRMRRCRSWQTLAVVAILSVLMASDQLFLYYSALAGGLLLLLAIIIDHRQFRRLGAAWLAVSVAAALLARLLLGIVGHVTHIVSGGNEYTHVDTIYGVVRGIEGTIQALSINFGITLRAGWLTLPGYVINICIVGAILWAVFRTMKYALLTQEPLDEPELLSVLLLMTTVAAVAIFATEDQPYLSNARYLSISLFAGFTVLAVQLKHIHIVARVRHVYVPGLLLTGVVCMAVVGNLRYINTMITKDPLGQDDYRIAQLLTAQHVTYLVGNYWRVFPIRMQTFHADQAVSPLLGCVSPSTVLNSATWQPNLYRVRFAYLLTVKPQGLPATLCQNYLVESQYGKPNSTVVVQGTEADPIEELLFYNNGATDRLRLRP